MKQPPTPRLPATMTFNTRTELLSAYTYTIVFTSFILTQFAFDISLCLLPWTRPAREWSLT